jgi:hypothetical protein
MALSPDMTAHAGPGGVKKTPARGRSGTRWRELDRYPSNVLAISSRDNVIDGSDTGED